VEPVHLVTSDGHPLNGDMSEAEGDVTGAVVICHPHPLMGGNRFNPVVDALFMTLPAHGLHVLRFDFRAVHGHGVAERLDVVAALDLLTERYPRLPLHLAGYSFGAAVILTVPDARITRRVAIAPPFGQMAVDPPTQPTLVLVAEHDQFFPPSRARPIVAGWPQATLEIVESADHFLSGRTAAVARTVAAWLATT
jgi:alpha/beta superfamily hydrolase